MIETLPLLSVTELQTLVSSKQPICILDVRQGWEYQLCCLPESLHIPLPELSTRLFELPTDCPIVVICHHGVRSQQAAKLLIQADFKEVYSLTGGIDAWARQIDSSISLY